jgi:1-acyl-sn-glycerol-3-phosphate acyltransferase
LKYVVTCAFGLYFALTAAPFLALIGLTWLVTAPFDPDRRAVHAVVARIGYLYCRINPFWRVRVEGRERLPQGPAVIVANHQSMADVIVAFGLFTQFKYVSKDSLFRVPIVGWAMRLARYVSLHRGHPHSAQLMLDSCRHWLRRGTSILMFPEGTYAPLGQLLPFRRGAFHLAIEQGVPVVPVVLEGTRSLMVEDGPWMEPTCRVRVRVLEPLPAAELGNDEAALAERVRGIFLRELGLTEPASSEAGAARTA